MDTNGKKKKLSKAEQHRRDTMQAYGVIFAILIVIMGAAVYMLFIKDDEIKTADTEPVDKQITASSEVPDSEPDNDFSEEESGPDESEPDESEPDSIEEPESSEPEDSSDDEDDSEPPRTDKDKHKLEVIDGKTYVDGILIVNKTYSLPSDYAPGILPEAQNAFDRMANDAWGQGVSLFICSGFRTYGEQRDLYDGYAMERGTEAADKVSSRAGHSEHQSGLAMDINTTDFSFEGTKEAVWLANHCADYGFIIRFPRGKEDITGYSYEPWHIRYVGEEVAKEIMDNDLCLEEYLGVTSDYRYSTDQAGNW